MTERLLAWVSGAQRLDRASLRAVGMRVKDLERTIFGYFGDPEDGVEGEVDDFCDRIGTLESHVEYLRSRVRLVLETLGLPDCDKGNTRDESGRPH